MKYVVLALLPLWILACSKDNESGNPGNTMPIDPGIVTDTFSVGFEDKFEPFVGLITRNTCGICGQSGHPLFDGFLAENPQVNGASFNYSTSDPLYHPEAKEYVDFVQISGTPNYIVNNMNFASSLDPWKNEVNQELMRSVLARMAMEGKMLSKDSAEITIRFVPQVNLNNYNVQLAIYLLENNVVSPQQDYGASPSLVENYIHNHVYRGSVSGIFGEAINSTLNQGDTLTIKRGVAIPTNVNDNNIYFMAVLFASDSQGNPIDVIQSQRLTR